MNELCIKLGGTESRIVSSTGDVVGMSGITIASSVGVVSTNPTRKLVFLNSTVVETSPLLYEVTVTPTGGGSSTTLPIPVTTMTDITISHILGRPPVVAVYDGQEEVKCTVTLPVGQELTHVRVQSSFPITGFIVIA
jgi:phosphoribosylcarboxyaminoimidazole (NCAIR) mutase